MTTTDAARGTVVIDRARCTGQGRCFAQSADVFDCDDQGFGLVTVDTVEADSDLAEQAEDAVLNCPESAIEVRW